MLDIINLAVPYFSLIFVGYACGKAKALPEAGLAAVRDRASERILDRAGIGRGADRDVCVFRHAD
jgi:hypothetical protein